MSNNTKILAFFSLLVITLGFGMLWFGFQPQNSANITPPILTPTPLREIKKHLNESSKSATLGIEGEKVVVTKVVDGDTIQISAGQTIRFIGIDTPETKDPRRPVGCFGKEASAKNKELIEGKEVVLEKDVSETDKYDRLLRYVYLPINDKEFLFINDYLVREGYATVLTFPPDVKFNEQFLESQRYAKENQKGLWNSCK